MTTTFTSNESTYTTTRISIGKTNYDILVVKGKFNYINVCKVTSKAFGIGKQFKNFDEATSHYKNRTMKVELLKVEMGIS